MVDGPDATDPTPGEGPSGRPLPMPMRLLGAGVRGARSVGKATGVERAVGSVAEDAMVAAIESEAVERALARVLQGPVVEEAVHGALDSEAVKRAVIDALDSELVDEVWQRLLASEEAQRLVERIAEAPELRAAISAQSVGFIEDIGHTIAKSTRRVDDGVERAARRLTFRARREGPTERAGLVSRALAFALDALIVNLVFSGLTAIVALLLSFLSGDGGGVSGFAIALGGASWLVLGGFYLVAFWSLAAQTPGMRFFGLRLGVEGRGLPPRRSLRRLVGMVLAALPLGLGFLGIVFDERRRGWQDRLAGVDVLYEVREASPAPWSTLDPGLHEAGAPGAAVPGPGSSATARMASEPGGFRPQGAS